MAFIHIPPSTFPSYLATLSRNILTNAIRSWILFAAVAEHCWKRREWDAKVWASTRTQSRFSQRRRRRPHSRRTRFGEARLFLDLVHGFAARGDVPLCPLPEIPRRDHWFQQ